MSKTQPTFPYYQQQEFTVTLNGQPVRVVSKPGIPEWLHLRPSSVLLAQEMHFAPNHSVCLVGSGHGALAVSLARRLEGGKLDVLEDNHLAASLTGQTLQANQVKNVQVIEGAFLNVSGGTSAPPLYDSAALDLPKGRKLARRRMLEIFAHLKPGGAFYLAGANPEGVQAVIKDAEALYGRQAAILAYKKGNRVARWIKPAASEELPDWAAEPGIAPGTWHEFTLPAHDLRLRSLPGVFSFDGLDEGTQLLLEQLGQEEGMEVLDFGCGSGVIGLSLSRAGAASVDMIDVSLLAVAAAQENIRLNQAANTRVLASDVLDAVAGQSYDLIVSNPPFHTGKGIDFQVAETFISHAHQLLRPKGRLIMVANRFIRYDRLMTTVFPQTSILAEDSKFHILSARR
jgi:16S rRNA (guanine1207-N2)-methyltransferase